MKKVLICFFLLFVSALNIQSQTPAELRGVWLTNVDSEVLTYDDASIAKAMDYLASIGINVVFPVMWNNGYTLYPSSVMHSRFGRLISPKCTGRDPLKRIIIEAHRNGIEVIPWMEYGFATSYASGSINDGIINKYPHWASRSFSGEITTDGSSPKTGFVWMSGLNPEVQDFIISLCTEMLDNYEIDGIQGDDRLPALPATGGYDSVTVSIYKAEHNGSAPPASYADQTWKRWRADKLNAFFARLRDSVKARGKDLILSSAPSPYYWGYDHHLQDSPNWVNNGIVDNFIPQIYPGPPGRSFAEYQYILNRTLQDINPAKKPITFSGVLAKVGSYVISPDQLIACVNENRKLGIKGETFFFYEGIANVNKKNGDTLKSAVYSKPALLPYRNGSLWRPKAVVVNEDDSDLISRTGKWTKEISPAIGYKPNVYLADNSSYSSYTYNVQVPSDGWYGVYVYVEPNVNLSGKAPYTLYSSSDSALIYVDQGSNKNKGWQKLKDVYLTKGLHKVVKLDNSGLEAGKFILADAVMIMINRKLSPGTVITTVENTVKKDDLIIAESCKLYNNYPNPFNPSTFIGCYLPQAAHMTIKVYDVLGREIAVLADSYVSAGEHKFEFTTAGLKSGVYFFRLQSGSYTETKKMILSK